MADVTGGVPPTNASAFAVPDDISEVYDHFGDQTMFSRANAASLPASGNWKGRLLMVEDTGILYQCTATPGTWVKAAATDDTGWITPTLQGSPAWTAFGGGFRGPGYRRFNGEGQIRGTIQTGVGTIFTLPPGFRPAAIETFLMLSNVGGVEIRVSPDGTVVPITYIAGGNNGIVSLAGIRFATDGS